MVQKTVCHKYILQSNARLANATETVLGCNDLPYWKHNNLFMY